MNKLFRAITVMVALLTVAITSFGLQQVQAATAPQSSTTNGLKISPVRTDLTIQPGTTGQVTVFVQNVTTSPVVLRGIVNDFVANTNESGQPNLILSENQYAASHSLKRFVAPIANLSLQPNEQKQVAVNITVPKNAAAGGYYGAVRFVPASAGTDSSVSLSASVGSLILARVPGDIKESLSLASFDVRNGNVAHRLFTSPNNMTAVLRFQNQGNIQVEPFGKLTVKDMHGKVLSQTEINNTDPRGNVLPDSIRRFDIPLSGLGSFGKYTLQGSFGYGTTGQLITASTTIYIVPVALLVAVGSGLLLIILAIIFVPKAIKAYNRRILRNARYR